MLTPALRFPVHVRRGERRYPLALTWLLQGARFTALRCPHCGQAAPLVAGREFLGCKVCLPPAAAAPPPAPTAEAATTGAAAVQAPTPASPSPPAVAKQRVKTAVAGAKRPAPVTPPVVDPLVAFAERYQRERQRAPTLGQQLAPSFWGDASVGVPWPRKQVMPDSPLEALYRLYGTAGPLFAIGIPARSHPTPPDHRHERARSLVQHGDHGCA